MARIPDGELERLKREVSLARLIEGQGIALVTQGKDLACRCPWHEGDDTPSCIVSPKTNLWHCFGCDAGGSVIDWVMRTHKVSFRHACELLAKEHPALAAAVSPAVPAPKLSAGKLRAAQSFSLDAGDQALLDQVIEFYHETLLASPEALAYLDKRGLGDRELIERFRLGYANRTLAYRLAPKQYKAGAELRAALQRVGILRESGHEHLNGSIVVPLFHAEGSGRHVVGAYGRKLLDNLRPGTPKHLYLPGPHRGVWNREGLEDAKEVILCEALIDAMTFWCAGYRHVTSCYGVHGMTDELLAALSSCGAERVLIAFDRDEAGDRGAEAIAKQLSAEGLDAFRIQFPKGEDANSYARAVGPAAKSLGLVIRSAEWLGQGAAPTRSVPAVREPDTTTPDPIVPLAAEPMSSDAVVLLADDVPSIEELPEPPAAAVPEAAPPEPLTEASEQQLVVVYGARRYRVRGWPKQLGEALKVNVLVTTGAPMDSAGPQGLHVDTLDLYQAKQRQAFARLAALELSVEESVIQHDLGRLLLKLESLIEARAKAAEQSAPPPAAMNEAQMTAALALLQDPQLIERIIEDVERVGLVGEPANALVAYLACVSRKLAAPLAVLIQSTSAAGKSTLMDTLLSLVPEEDRVQYSAMTGQSLFYLGETDLKHRILAIAEEEGVRQAAYALKVLQSQGELTIASTGKDPATGMLVTQQYRVEGPVMLCLTTTAIDVDEELVNRCLVLTINESREQTRRIQERQRRARTLAGLVATSEAQSIRELHQNAQRLLRPLSVVNPYAEQLTFLDDRTRTRRDHAKYLTLIEAIALVHQHQRAVRTTSASGKPIEYIEVELTDIELANRLAHDVLGRSLDELPPQTRRVLGLIESFVAEIAAREAMKPADVRFTRRQLRERCGMSDAAVRVHLERLLAMEYVRAAVGRNGLKFEYELAFDGDLAASAPQMMGLIDVNALRAARTMPTSQGSEADLAPRLQAARAPLAATLQGGVEASKAYEKSLASVIEPESLGTARPGIEPMVSRDRNRTPPAPARRSLDPLAANAVTA
ncbi:MAG: CHC2 zinc finger domain-containing protein [Burkholderiales bacterium]|jgi:DNA primase catalytic core|nr:CHC2 zinc finger domain-containing protein [Burkholderiales bacterium]